MRSIGVWLVVALSACAQSDAVHCEFGTCPGGYACDVAHDRCVLPAQLTDCAGMPDDTACTAGANEGLCIDEVCLTKGCGDYRLDGAEECDGDLFIRGATDCLEVGFYTSGPIACRADCTIDTSQCGTQRCGDGVLDSDKNEICEPSLAETSTTCDALGFYNTADVACTSFCTFDIQSCAGYCGDNLINGPELCDGTQGLPSFASCLDYGHDGGSLQCSAGCFADTAACHHHDLTPVAISDVFGTTLYLTSATSGFIAGTSGAGNGLLSRWDGVTTTPIAVPDGARFNAISGTGDTNVYMVGGAGRIAHYDGISVTDTFPAVENYNGIHMLTPTDGYVAGYTGATTPIVRHFDGNTWTKMTTPGATALQAIFATSATDIWAVGSLGVILHGNGASWATTPSTTSNFLRAVWGSSGTDVFAVGDAGTIVHYNGQVWSKMPSPTANTLGAIWGNGPDDVYALGSFDYLHYDGQHWVRIETATPSLADVKTWDAEHVVIAQGTGGLQRFEGTGWKPVDTFQDYARQLWGASETDLYLANGTKVQHYDGITWTQVAGVTGNGISAVWGTAADDVFVGDDSSVHHWDGMQWTTTAVGDEFVYSFWGASKTNVWAVTELGTLYHYDGQSWTFAFSFGDDGHQLWGSGANDIYMAGGQLWHYDGAWSQVTLPISQFADVWGSGASDVYTVADDQVWHYNGATWSKLDVPNPNRESLWTVTGTGPNDVFVAGDRILMHYDGTAWTRVRPQTSSALYGDLWVTAHDIVGTLSQSKQVSLLRRACATCGL